MTRTCWASRIKKAVRGHSGGVVERIQVGEADDVAFAPDDFGDLRDPARAVAQPREVHDEVLRLDRSLGVFLDSLFKSRDSTRIIIALSADHGVAPNPNESARDTRRIVGP